MSEQSYAFTVEAFILGLCNVQLVAQRWDVFTWPVGRTLPVLGTSLLGLLIYAQVLLFLACFIKISNLTALSLEICEALVRCIGRLSTLSVGWVIYMSIMVWGRPHKDWALTLCQLWGTACRKPGNSQIWSYSYSLYLGILLPCLALQAALQTIAASSMKLTRYAPRRMLYLNALFLLTLHGVYTVNQNYIEACDGQCKENNATNTTYFSTTKKVEPKTITSSMILGLAVLLACLDIVADICAALATKHDTVAAIVFVVSRGLQVLAIPLVIFALEFDFLLSLAFTHIGLATVVGIMDAFDVYTQYSQADTNSSQAKNKGNKKDKRDKDDEEEDSDEERGTLEEPQTANSAFTLEPVRRKRFVFSVGNKTRWPHRTRPFAGINKKSQ